MLSAGVRLAVTGLSVMFTVMFTLGDPKPAGFLVVGIPPHLGTTRGPDNWVCIFIRRIPNLDYYTTK
jgi:hypothetical protein